MYLYNIKGERYLFVDKEIDSLGEYIADPPTSSKGQFNVSLKNGNIFKAYGTIKDYDMVLTMVIKNFSPNRRESRPIRNE